MSNLTMGQGFVAGGPFPMLPVNQVEGGPFFVADLATRNAIPAYLRREGAKCYVLATSTWYKLGPDAPWTYTSTDWTAEGSGGGGVPHQLVGAVATENQATWTVAATFVFDPAKETTSPTLHAIMSTTSALVSASVRIFDVTANAVIANSTLNTSATSPTELTSLTLTMGATRRTYELQIKAASTQATAICTGAWLEF